MNLSKLGRKVLSFYLICIHTFQNCNFILVPYPEKFFNNNNRYLMQEKVIAKAVCEIYVGTGFGSLSNCHNDLCSFTKKNFYILSITSFRYCQTRTNVNSVSLLFIFILILIK